MRSYASFAHRAAPWWAPPRRHSSGRLLFGTLAAFAFLSVAAGRHPGQVVTLASQDVAAISMRTTHKLQARVEPAVMIGGILIERHRHALAGAILGCGTGAGIGAAAAAGIGVATGGVGFLTAPVAAAVGCGIGGIAGIPIGRPLDDYGLAL